MESDPKRHPGKWWFAALCIAFALAAIASFGPGLRAGFVSDTFVFIEEVHTASRQTVIEWFVPAGNRFYRPLYLVMLWGAERVFGPDPLGYHVLALLMHVGSAVLLSAIAFILTQRRLAAAVSGLTFLWSIHAHEVVFDVATLHHALGGFILLVGVFAWMRGDRGWSLLAIAAGMFVNELALLAAPILGLYELSIAHEGTIWKRVRRAFSRVAPHIALSAGYVAIRLAVAGQLPEEGATCLTPRCLVVALAEYVNRLLLRPEALLALAWTYRPILATAAFVVVVGFTLLLWSWGATEWRASIFPGGWTLLAVAYVIVSLWPYVSDRFLYVPDMGLALLAGWIAGEGGRSIRQASSLRRVAIGVALALLGAWIASGGYMIRERGDLWRAAGMEAERIIEEIHALAPTPPARASFCIVGAPDSYLRPVAPGNTGPYVFRNGLGSALRIRYGRRDLTVIADCQRAFAVFSVGAAPVRLIRP